MKLEYDPDFRDMVTFVLNKKIPVYNWFYYKEGFSRELVMRYLKLWKPSRLLDPFAGSGTSLLAAKEYGIPSTGLDVNPVALLAARVKTADWDREKLMGILRSMKSEPFEKQSGKFPYARFFPRPAQQDILFLKKQISSLEMPEREFFQLGLINAAYKCSWMYKDGAVLKLRKKPVPPLRKYFFRTTRRMVKQADRIKGPVPLVLEADARTMSFHEEFDSCITSPPYLNKIEYQKIYGMEMWIIGRKEKPGVRSFISGGKVVDEYFADIEKVLERLYEAMKHGGKVAWVVAGGIVEGEPIESDVRTAEIAESLGFRVMRIAVARRRVATVHRTIKIGSSRESVIEMEKP